jgi:hypothetical protein
VSAVGRAVELSSRYVAFLLLNACVILSLATHSVDLLTVFFFNRRRWIDLKIPHTILCSGVFVLFIFSF